MMAGYTCSLITALMGINLRHVPSNVMGSIVHRVSKLDDGQGASRLTFPT
jgi:hypothetical protein